MAVCDSVRLPGSIRNAAAFEVQDESLFTFAVFFLFEDADVRDCVITSVNFFQALRVTFVPTTLDQRTVGSGLWLPCPVPLCCVR